MSYQFPPDVKERVSKELAAGNYQSEDEVLRAAMAALKREREDIEAIAAGIEDMNAGRVRPFEEADLEFRTRHNIARTA